MPVEIKIHGENAEHALIELKGLTALIGPAQIVVPSQHTGVQLQPAETSQPAAPAPAPLAAPAITPPPVAPPVSAAVPVAGVPTTAPAAAPATTPVANPPSATVPTTVESYTLDQLAVAATALMDAGRQSDLVNLLGQFGVQALTALPKERYGEFATALRQMGAKI